MHLTSSGFSDCDEMPIELGYKNGNETPALSINGIPEGTKSLALIMDDPDAMGAVGKVWLHWLEWNIIPNTLDYSFFDLSHREDHFVGVNDFGEEGYGGPAPPDKRHTYIFKLYALDTTLILPDKSTKADVEKAMEGHIIEQTQLTGTYAP